MRSEKEMMDLVLSLAEQDERIRIVTLEGSRANINIPKDEFQDYDITYFVSDIEPFISNDDWLKDVYKRQAPTINEETLQTAVVKAINELLANKEPFLSTLQKNIATIFNEENDNATDDIDGKLEELQQQLLIQAKRCV